MMARLWRGRTRSRDAREYVDYVKETGIREQRNTPGNRGSMILHRDLGDETEILVLSLWESMESVRVFAGDPVGRAVYYPEDERYLLNLEPEVAHYEVAVAAPHTPDCSSGFLHLISRESL